MCESVMGQREMTNAIWSDFPYVSHQMGFVCNDERDFGVKWLYKSGKQIE